MCDGEVTAEDRDQWGVIDEQGANLSVLLGGEFRSNGVNCAPLGISSAASPIVASGSGATADRWVRNTPPEPSP